jgi:hypothetical protein
MEEHPNQTAKMIFVVEHFVGQSQTFDSNFETFASVFETAIISS